MVRRHVAESCRGYVHVHVLKYSSSTAAPEAHRNPQTRTTTESMQALVRVQAHMLARNVVEIRAADIAIEVEPYHGSIP